MAGDTGLKAADRTKIALMMVPAGIAMIVGFDVGAAIYDQMVKCAGHGCNTGWTGSAWGDAAIVVGGSAAFCLGLLALNLLIMPRLPQSDPATEGE